MLAEKNLQGLYQRGRLLLETNFARKEGTSVDANTQFLLADISKHSSYSILFNNSGGTNALDFTIEETDTPNDATSWIKVATVAALAAGASQKFTSNAVGAATRILVKSTTGGNPSTYKVLFRLSPIPIVA